MNSWLKMIMCNMLLLLMFLQRSTAVIYSLNDTQYTLMPQRVHLDPYKECQKDADPLYCTTEFVLVSDQPSPLLDMIKEYSEHYVSHYNHTKLLYGICITQTCKTFYNKEGGDLKMVLEACLNETFMNKHELKVRVLDQFCHLPGEAPKKIDTLDIIVGIICIGFLMSVTVGSLYDIYFQENGNNGALRFLLCFSLRRNWNKLVTPVPEDTDPRIQRLKFFYSFRTIIVSFVIIFHSFLYAYLLIDNPNRVEEIYLTKPYYILLNGTLIMQIYLMMSAFLLVYLSLMHLETHQMTWAVLPKRILRRWLRLTPSYALVIGLTATWFGHLASGPMWNRYVAREMNDCRQFWWRNILYINNFYSDSECNAQAWYLAVDTQLYFLAVVIFLACRTTRSRVIALSSLFFVGMIIPAVIVYLQDLDGIQRFSPDIIINMLIVDDHFNNVYICSYCNIPGYIVGMTMAYLVYHWQKRGVDFKQYQTFFYRMLYWAVFPLGVLCCYSGGLFYQDAPRPSVYVRAAYAAFLKPVFSLLSAVLITGLIFKFEDKYRSFLEWRGWMIPSRLSYSAYLLHIACIRNYVALQTETTHIELIPALQVCLLMLIMTFAAALIFSLLVEAPINNIIKECIPEQNGKLPKNSDNQNLQKNKDS